MWVLVTENELNSITLFIYIVFNKGSPKRKRRITNMAKELKGIGRNCARVTTIDVYTILFNIS